MHLFPSETSAYFFENKKAHNFRVLIIHMDIRVSTYVPLSYD